MLYLQHFEKLFVVQRRNSIDHLAQQLSTTALFRGISSNELVDLLHCLDIHTRSFASDEVIFRMGDTLHSFGIILSGSVRMEHIDAWGNISVLGAAHAGDVFAASYACTPGSTLLVNVVAAAPTKVALLNVKRIVSTCAQACPSHAKLMTNLLAVCARKNIELSQHAFHTSPKSIRGKLMSYLSFEAARAESNRIVIPFNRQQLANYLGVDRSALSSELTRMQRDGLIHTHKNEFELVYDKNTIEAPHHHATAG